ncbi:hypothetical protein PV08_08816 [Exophiala spinifera]|uniref:Uncharacterized protein n=1 Tax=Exophiala spinifera TaxID=91928 RepID=A0A0D2B4K9_9EURO|nr:uncharacterized protein PV08_08816 [Exophiala spinifera]KIW13625.1 hypothetical protein PV08_08816 [Exophiala spinifera]
MLYYGPTYIWRRDLDIAEQNTFSNNIVQWLLSEPALTEAVFAAARRQMAIDSTSEPDTLTGSMQHYNRAISLLQQRVGEASAAFDDSIFWAVIALLVSDQEREDWNSYCVNLDGIRRIVHMRGGMSSLKASCSRSYRFYLWAEACFSNRNNIVNETGLLATPPVVSSASRSMSATFNAPFEDLFPFVRRCSPGFLTMIESHPFHCETMTVIDRSLEWFIDTATGKHQAQKVNPHHELADGLHRLLQKGAISDRERLVCVGLLALVLGTFPASMPEQYQRTLSKYISRLGELSDAILREDCTLWVAFAIAAMPASFDITQIARWGLLDRILRTKAQPSTWDDVRHTVRQFYATSQLEEEWRKCWFIWISRGCGNSEHTQSRFQYSVEFLR